MGRWKRYGVVVWCCLSDHQPRHVHLFEDGQEIVKFDLDHWLVLKGRLTSKMRKALESLRSEGILDEGPQI